MKMRLSIHSTVLLLIGLISFSAGQSIASQMLKELIDPKDGQIDTTSFLSSRYGFTPVPIIITEPAIGYGGGMSLVYLHDPLAGTDNTEA